MNKVFVTSQSRYPANNKELKHHLRRFLTEKGVRDADLSIAFVGERKIKDLAKTYLGEEDSVHEVLSFPSLESRPNSRFVMAQEARLQLGDVVICYPEARKIAMKENRMVDVVLQELAEHGALHLLGIHHD